MTTCSFVFLVTCFLSNEQIEICPGINRIQFAGRFLPTALIDAFHRAARVHDLPLTPLEPQPFVSELVSMRSVSAWPCIDETPMSLHLSAITAALSSWTLNSQFVEGSKQASLIFPSRSLFMARAPNLLFNLRADSQSATSCQNPSVASVSKWAHGEPLSIASWYSITARVTSSDHFLSPVMRLEADDGEALVIRSHGDTVLDGELHCSISRVFDVSLPWHPSYMHSSEPYMVRSATASFEFTDCRSGLRVCERRIVYFQFVVPLTQRCQLRPISDKSGESRMSLGVLLQASPFCGAWVCAYRIRLPPGCGIAIDHNDGLDRADYVGAADSTWRASDWIVPPGQVRTLFFELTSHATAIVDSDNAGVDIQCAAVSPTWAKQSVAEHCNTPPLTPAAEKTAAMRLLPVVLAASSGDAKTILECLGCLPTSIVSAISTDETRTLSTQMLTCSWSTLSVANPVETGSKYEVQLALPSEANFRRGCPIEVNADISVRACHDVGFANNTHIIVDVVCNPSHWAVLGRQRALFALPPGCGTADRQRIGLMHFRLVPLVVGHVALPAFRLREVASTKPVSELGGASTNLAASTTVECGRVCVQCAIEDVYVSL